MNLEQAIDRLWPGASPLEKRQRLEKFRITEISAVDRPANEHARAVVMKRADDLPDPQRPQDVERKKTPSVRMAKPKKDKRVKPSAIAKALIDTGETSMDPGYFHDAIAKRAAKIRREGETPQMAYSRAITEDEKGRTLFKAMQQSNARRRGADLSLLKHAVGDTPEVEAARGAGPVHRSLVEAKLDLLAKECMKADPSLSYQRAYAQIFELPQHKALRDEVRTAGLVRAMRLNGEIA